MSALLEDDDLTVLEEERDRLKRLKVTMLMCVHALHVCLTAGRLVAACLKAAKPPAPEPRSVEVPLPRFSVQAALTTICALSVRLARAYAQHHS